MKLRAIGLSVLVVVSMLTAGLVVEPGTVGGTAGPGAVDATGASGTVAASGFVDVAASDLPGNGTSDNPYEISNASELQAVNDSLSANYTLVSNIDASETAIWNKDKGFNPIANNSAFTGSFNGSGHTITGLTVNRSSTNNVGLFGKVGSGGVVENVELVDVNITGDGRVGGLVGENYGTVNATSASGNVSGSWSVGGLVGDNLGTVRESNATANVSGHHNVGGLVGESYGTITASYATGDLNGPGDNFGGLAGFNGGTVKTSHATGNVTGNVGYVGGLVGRNDGPVNASYATGNINVDRDWVGGLVGYNTGNVIGSNATGNVSGKIIVGGLAGYNEDSTVTASNATGNVNGVSKVGGLVGLSTGDSTVNESYATGNVNGSSSVGGLVGQNDGSESEVNVTHASGNVTGAYNVGGLVGSNGYESTGDVGGTIQASNASGTISVPQGATGNQVGGLVGHNYQGHITTSSATGDVNASDASDVGGLVGYNNQSQVDSSYATGSVNGSTNVGGLVGYNNQSQVDSSYATGTISGESNIGGLVGHNRFEGWHVSLYSVHATGDVTGTDHVGGLVGSNGLGSTGAVGGTIWASNASGTVSVPSGATGNQVGGLVGHNYQARITNSNAKGAVDAGDATSVGGLVGYTNGTGVTASVYASYATGNVTGSESVGGLTGTAVNTVVNRTYAVGAVTGDAEVAGLVGNATGGSTEVTRSYAAGAVTGTSDVGGLVGVTTDSPAVQDAYWDVNTTTQPSSAGGTGLTTTQLKANTSLAGFDFTNTWAVVDNGTHVSYPYLQAMAQSPAPGLESIFHGGSGTEADPYQIADWYDLDNTREDLDANYTLVADLDEDTAGYDSVANATANDGQGFNPIANGSAFTGSFDGNGHTITGLTVNRSSTINVGLFGKVGSDGVVENVGLVDVDVTGSYYAGGLVGENYGTVNASYATGTVTGEAKVGGLVGYSSGTVTASNATGHVSGSSDYIGGLVGENHGTVTASYATGNVTGTEDVGGLVGISFGPVTASYATGNVTGTNYVGGLVGHNYNATVTESYATGNVTGSQYVGGLVGLSTDTVSASYATGNVNGSTDVGGLVGYNSGTVSDAYWDTEATNQSSSAGGTGLTTSQLKANTGLTGFDFTNTWAIVNNSSYISYPYLADNVQTPEPGLETNDTTAPSITGFEATNPSGHDIRVEFDSDEQLSTIEVVISGAESATLTSTDFTETANGDGTYTYSATYGGSSDGTYTATLETAVDAAGNDGATGQNESVSVEPDYSGGGAGGGSGGSGEDDDGPDDGEEGQNAIIEVEIENRPSQANETPQVLVEGSSVTAGTDLSIDVSNRSTDSLGASLDRLDMHYAGRSNFTMQISYYPANPQTGVENYSVGPASAPLQYVSVTHSFANADVSDVRFLVRVNRSRLEAQGATPQNVSFARYHDGAWTDLPTDLVAANATHVVYEVDSPGFSLFAVVVPQPSIGVDSLAAENTTVRPGEAVEVTATVQNSGHLEGNTTVEFRQGGTTLATRTVQVAATATETVTLTREFDEPGTYTLAVGDRTVEVTVQQAETPTTSTPGEATTTATPTETQPAGEETETTVTQVEDGDFGWVLPVVFLVLLVAVVLAVAWVRSRSDEEDTEG